MARIGIRREDKNEWERRAPLTPDHVAELVDTHGVEVAVQPSSVRAFPDKDYRAAGATLDEELTGCGLILGIKEIPLPKIEPGKAYLYFSHTTKGQPKNMPALRRLLDTRSTLIDYEHIVDENRRRLVAFGRYAGHSGMIDALWALGRRLAAEGHATPLGRIRLAHDYDSLDEASHHVSRVGEALRHEGIPRELRPVVFGFTGAGNVALGAQEIFDRLPHVALLPEELEDAARDTDLGQNALYKVVFGRAHRFARKDGGPFDADELTRHPERYAGGLSRWLSQLTVLVHGAFWSPAQPRVVTHDDLAHLWSGGVPPRLRLLADISCDVGGGIEATVRATTPGDPVYVYDVATRETTPGPYGDGPLVLAIDNLPCQLPVESSEHFGDNLIRFLPALARCRWERPIADLELPQELARAVIAHRGELAPSFRYLAPSLGAVR